MVIKQIITNNLSSCTFKNESLNVFQNISQGNFASEYGFMLPVMKMHYFCNLLLSSVRITKSLSKRRKREHSTDVNIHELHLFMSL